MRALTEKLDVSRKVLWLGERDAASVMAAFDLLALPSRKEGLPYVALEALAAGLPIVATESAGVGLIVAVALWPRHWKSELPVAQGEEAFGSFIKIARDGKITVAVPQVETGQGIWTALPQIVADELGAAWETVAIEPAPLAKVYANSLAEEEGWPASIRITANSTSVRAFEQPLREAAATARTMLIGAAADRWNVDPSTCETADGFVISGVRTATFGELAEEAADRSPPARPPLRAADKQRLIGQPLQRLDGPAKSDGSWRFAGDVRTSGLLFASARLAPPGGRLKNYSRDAIGRMPGIVHIAARDRPRHEDLCPEPPCLLQSAAGQLAARDARREAEVVLDPG